MILGLTTSTYTLVHVIISLVAIAAGFVVVFGLMAGKRFNTWTAFFLITTIATSVGGFGFPIHKIGPPHIIGVISLVVLALALVARYRFRMAGPWRWIYIVSAITALYFNVFVGVVQAFQKIDVLKSLAPTQTEPPFAAAQVGVLLLFIALGISAARRFRGEAMLEGRVRPGFS